MIKLYYGKGSCSLSPHIALYESGLKFEAIPVDLRTHTLGDGTDYYTINPLGYVPLLVLPDGTQLSEGVAIVQYIADQAPDKKLAPANGTSARYQLQSRLNFIATELHKNFGPLFKPNTPEAYKPIAKGNIEGRLKHVNGVLGKTPYLTGDQFTVADGYLFTVLSWTSAVGVDIEPLTNLRDFQKRVSARPGVQAALKAEGLA